MTDDFAGKAVVLVTLGVGRGGYVWLVMRKNWIFPFSQMIS
jgi:hypothetical protein